MSEELEAHSVVSASCLSYSLFFVGAAHNPRKVSLISMTIQNFVSTQTFTSDEQKTLALIDALRNVRQHVPTWNPSPRNTHSDVAVLIPAWNPDADLLKIVNELAARGFGAIIVVDDGSEADSTTIFAQFEAVPSVHLIRHTVNRGKGRALKTGIEFFLSELSLKVLVTADADGQHAVEDIVRVTEALGNDTSRITLGARVFGKDVPLRSRVGNCLTRRLFNFVTGVGLADTQTGLRAFPRHVLPGLLALNGERYEYEMTVLAHVCRDGAKPLEVPIQTIYLEGNRSSHFDPVRDSLRIYSVLMRFYLSSVFAEPRRSGLALVGNVFTSAGGRLGRRPSSR